MTTEVKTNDAINPAHYDRYQIQPIDFIVGNKLNFLQGNVIKYVVRYEHKNGLEDLLKARAYLDRMIREEEEKVHPPIRFKTAIVRGGTFNGA